MPVIYGIGSFIASLFVRTFTAGTLSKMFVVFTILPHLVNKIIALIGLTTVTLYGLNLATDSLIQFFNDRASTLPADVFAMLGLMKIDVAMSMLVSVGIIKSIMRGVINGTQTTSNWGKPRKALGNPFSTNKDF